MLGQNMRKLITLSLLCVSLSATAGIRQYSAGLSAVWQVTENSRLQCTLSHKIPHYGEAKFYSKAGRELNMAFELDMLRLPDTYGLAEVRAVSPRWKPGQSDYTIADMRLYKQFSPDLPKKVAWTMLSELEQGMNTTFYYNDWYNDRDKIAVTLSNARFLSAYQQFVSCVGNLLDFSFDDIAYTVLNYQSNSDELTKVSKKRLAMIAEYLSLDNNLELVLLDAYTDSYGGRWPNLKLSERRAEKIKQFFIDKGIDPKRIMANGYGEKRPVASNETVLGRAENRRIVIKLDKP
jgi:outer membrane protein OmpA-like peptidoglycan-associated protein